MKSQFKKLFSFVLISIFILLATGSVALAEDPQVKVYLQESIGAGEEVYHVTQCSKMPKLVPLRCTSKNAEEFKNQCISTTTEKDSSGRETTKEKVLLNKYIKICRKVKDASSGKPNRQLAREADLTKCEKVSEQDPVVDTAWAIYKCVSGKEDCKADDPDEGGGAEKMTAKYKYGNRIIMGTIVHEGKPTKDDDGSPLETAYPGMVGVAGMYEVGAELNPDGTLKTGGKTACIQADYYASGDNRGKIVEPAVGMPDTFLLPECTTYNGSFIGDGRPIWTCMRGERITGGSGTDLLANFIRALYRWAASIVGIIAVLVIVISGIQISTAGSGEAGGIDAAKKRILQSIAGLIILFLSGLILYTINPTFFVK